MFTQGKNTFDTNIPVREIIINEIKKLKVISPVVDDRLIDVSGKTSMFVPFDLDMAA